METHYLRPTYFQKWFNNITLGTGTRCVSLERNNHSVNTNIHWTFGVVENMMWLLIMLFRLTEYILCDNHQGIQWSFLSNQGVKIQEKNLQVKFLSNTVLSIQIQLSFAVFTQQTKLLAIAQDSTRGPFSPKRKKCISRKAMIQIFFLVSTINYIIPPQNCHKPWTVSSFSLTDTGQNN